jgi:hypothetical protein
MNNLLEFKPFADINLKDSFFDSLRQDYPQFDEWFLKKTTEKKSAFVFETHGKLDGFLFLKSEIDVEIADVSPQLPKKRWLKIGTFKINPHGTRLGERFLKTVLDNAIHYKIDAVYVTVFPKHKALIELFERYGFEEKAIKPTNDSIEKVLVKELGDLKNNILYDYPKFSTRGNQKFLLSIFPEFHTQLFPNSKLNNESYELIKDLSHTNSIEKVYICSMDCRALRRGDALVIYRTTDEVGRAKYRAVATSVCTVEEIKVKNDFTSLDNYLSYCENYSVFNRQELTEWFHKNNRLYIIKMVYNAAFSKRLTRGHLLEKCGLSETARWGFLPLTDNQFHKIIKDGSIYESLIIH